MERFYLEEYIDSQRPQTVSDRRRAETSDFEEACRIVEERFAQEWEQSKSQGELLSLQKNAIMGHESEKEYFKSKIRAVLEDEGMERISVPEWYESPQEAIYHRLWGMAGVAEWFSEKYKDSSSAKVIGERIYFMENGRMNLKPQRISAERREQLIRAFLLINPREKSNKDFHELYLLDGTRVTVFRNGLSKSGEETIIFRRYVMPEYSFEAQAAKGTIPAEAAELFKSMVKLGFNCAFVGEIRSAKTTFMTTWQSYEDRSLEGVLVETDPEIPLHLIMPEAPIVQVLADGEKLAGIVKNLMRSDADYFIIGEARDAIALSTALRIAERGGKRLKMTFHLKDPLDFPYNVAHEICSMTGGNEEAVALRTAGAFDYVFHLASLSDRSQKRLMGIYEMGTHDGKIKMHRICRYEPKRDSWSWENHVSSAKSAAAEESDPQEYARFRRELERLAVDSGTEAEYEK